MSSYSRVYPCAIPCSRIFHNCEQSRFPRSDSCLRWCRVRFLRRCVWSTFTGITEPPPAFLPPAPPARPPPNLCPRTPRGSEAPTDSDAILTCCPRDKPLLPIHGLKWAKFKIRPAPILLKHGPIQSYLLSGKPITSPNILAHEFEGP
jgi:hypothetical protein